MNRENELLVVFYLLVSVVGVVVNCQDVPLPDLHVIRSSTFQTTYGCGGNFQQSSLFVSSYGVKTNNPDVIYNGGCDHAPVFQSTLPTGNIEDFGQISDLGEIAIEDVSAKKAFNFYGKKNSSNMFQQVQYVYLNHTYAFLLAKADVRGLLAVKITDLQLNNTCSYDWVVLQYDIVQQSQSSPGFSWDATNHKL